MLVHGQQKYHHYVTRWYLERFAETDWIWVGDASNWVVRRSRTAKTGGEKFFNALVLDATTKSNQVETWLADEVEGPARDAFDRLAIRGPGGISVDERVAVSRFLAFQSVRVPAHRTPINGMLDQIERLRGGPLPGLAAPEERQNWQVASMLVSAGEGFRYIHGRTWEVLTLPSAAGPLFPTSDVPVMAWTAADDYDSFYGHGFMTADQLVVVLDPRRVLIMHHPPGGPTKPPLGGPLAQVPHNLLRLTATSGHRFWYSHPKSAFFRAPGSAWQLPA